MKRKLLYLVCIALAIMCLYSCKPEENSPPTNSPSSNSEKIYGDGIVTYMAYDDYIKNGDYGPLLLNIYQKIRINNGTQVKYGQNPDKAEHEIVLGDVQRQIAKDARAQLDNSINKAILNAPNEAEARIDYIGYSIYASGNSVAVVWSHPDVAETAIQYFINNYLSDPSLELEDGYIHSEILSYLDVLAQKDEKQKEEEWAAVENVLGPEATQALKNHYSIFNEDFYYWLADLYDPVTGGFYFSNSARNNEGYLPDMESTAQALSFLNESGMTASYGGYAYALGDEAGEAIVSFVKSLQSSKNGYFYHPQWEGLDYTDSRLARDATWAVGVINTYYNYFTEPYRKELEAQGLSTSEIEKKIKENPELQKYMLLYDTPTGYKGLLGAPGANAASAVGLTQKLQNSSVASVSKISTVASDASRWTPQLRSLEAWRAYLYGGTVTDVVTGKPVTFPGFSLKNSSSYVTGNTISSQAAQIKNRDSIAKANGEPSGYAEITKKFFDDGVNPKNGTWADSVTHGAINGLMKIGQLYNTLGWELKYPDKAIESAVKIVLLEGNDEEGVGAISSSYIYNGWVCIQYIFNNVSNFNHTVNRSEFLSKYRKYVIDNAAEMIRVTTQHTAKLAQGDGSFSYYVSTPCTYSQGMPVALPEVFEGDVNGATIACTGIITNMAKALGIESIKPSVYYSADMEKFLRRMNGLGEIIKDDLVNEVPPYTFEAGELGMDGFAGAMNDGERLVIEHNVHTAENKNMFSFIDFGKTTGSTTTFPAQGVLGALAKSFILEFDVYFEDINASSYIQLTIGEGTKRAYMLWFDGQADGSVTVGDSSNTDATVAVHNRFGITIPGKEWHNIRLEYYIGTEETVKTKVYIDGSLKYISNNFYGKLKNESVDPGITYSKAAFFSTSSSTLTVYLDNIIVQRSVDEYVHEDINSGTDDKEPEITPPGPEITPPEPVIPPPSTDEDSPAGDNNPDEEDVKGDWMPL